MDGYLCENCGETFSDPVCEECQLRELEAWLIDQNYNKITRQIILRAVKKQLISMEGGFGEPAEVACEICHNLHLLSCPYCFDTASFMVLRKFHAKHEMLEKFVRIFPLSH